MPIATRWSSLIGTSAALSALPAASLGEPPSSIKPKAAEIQLVHSHRRTVSCTRVVGEEGALCLPRDASARAGTQITFSPVPSKEGLLGGDERNPVTVSIADSFGSVASRATLAPGIWATRWTGKAVRFGVAPGEHLDLRLETTTGACEDTKDACVLHASRRKRTLDVPDDNRR